MSEVDGFEGIDATLARVRCQRPGCDHPRSSHGSFDVTGRFIGMGWGRCEAYGPDHDTCRCEELVATAPVPVS